MTPEQQLHLAELKPHHDYIMQYPVSRAISLQDSTSNMMQLFIKIAAERGHPILKPNCGACVDAGLMFINSYYQFLNTENESTIAPKKAKTADQKK